MVALSSSSTATMADRGKRRGRAIVFSLLGAVVCLGVISLGVTVVPDGEVAKTDLNGNPAFEAHQFVDKIWTARVLPALRDSAHPITDVLDAIAKDPDAAGRQYGHRLLAGDGPWNYLVRGEGRIKAAETKLRHATLTVDVAGHDVTLQLGPVIFGTALRDSLPFISFDNVVNQIQFAQISRELNDRATAATRAGLDVDRLVPGARVSFTGAMASGNPPSVTLLSLKTVDAP